MDREYALMTGNDLANEQLHCLETILDPHSTQFLTDTGVKPGMNCLDIGSGSGSITRWLASRVGPAGRVVSVDTDPKYEIKQSGVDWRCHDLNEGVPEGGPFDLIHGRLVMMHLKRRDEILVQLIDALKPGGWLVLGDFTGLPLKVESAPSPEDEKLFHRFQEVGINTIGVGAGISYTWAAELDTRLSDAGLRDVTTVQRGSVDAGGSPGCLLHRNYNFQLEQLYLNNYGFTDVELKRYRELMLDPRFRAWMYTFYMSRGQKVS